MVIGETRTTSGIIDFDKLCRGAQWLPVEVKRPCFKGYDVHLLFANPEI